VSLSSPRRFVFSPKSESLGGMAGAALEAKTKEDVVDAAIWKVGSRGLLD